MTLRADRPRRVNEPLTTRAKTEFEPAVAASMPKRSGCWLDCWWWTKSHGELRPPIRSLSPHPTRKCQTRGQGCHDRTKRTVHPRGFVSLESGYSSASCLASSRKQHGNLAAPPSPHTNSAIVEPGVCGQPTANAGQNQPSHQSSGRSCHGGNSTILSSLGPLSGRMRKYFTRRHVGAHDPRRQPARRRMRSCFVPPSCERWTNRAPDPWKETRWQRTPTA